MRTLTRFASLDAEADAAPLDAEDAEREADDTFAEHMLDHAEDFRAAG